ncbi:hypothetical protein [Prevotella jejuni]|nr:hypothetical protein [Prevotella jejuni]
MKKRLSAVVFTLLSYRGGTEVGPYLSLKIKRLRIPAKPFV